MSKVCQVGGSKARAEQCQSFIEHCEEHQIKKAKGGVSTDSSGKRAQRSQLRGAESVENRQGFQDIQL